MNNIRTKAIILRRTNYGEADRIINFLTPVGKISAIAKGVRKEKSRLSGGLELFAICDVVIHSGNGDLGVLTSAQIIRFYKDILNNYDRVEFAYEIIKAISQASESLSENSWYNLLASSLRALGNLKISLKVIKTWFFLRYSSIMGHSLSLNYDIKGDKLLVDRVYIYNQEEKGLELSDSGCLTANHIKLLRLLEINSPALVGGIIGLNEIIDDCLLVTRNHAAI